MFDLRLLVTDVDRTLLTHDYVLPTRVLEALRSIRETGVILILATARSPAALRPYAEQLSASELAICFNGGWVGNVSTGTARHRQPIGRAIALEVMAAGQAAGVNPMWFTGTQIHVFGNNEIVAREACITGERLKVASDARDLPGDPGKIMCVAPSPADRPGFELMRKRFASELSVVRSHPRLLEIGPLGVSKRIALEAIADELGVTREQCAAAGDAENDLEMLAWAGVAVTVENAVPEAKHLAGFVGPSCDSGGLADGVTWLMNGRTPRLATL